MNGDSNAGFASDRVQEPGVTAGLVMDEKPSPLKRAHNLFGFEDRQLSDHRER